MALDDAVRLAAAANRVFTKALLTDLQALEKMLRDGMIESGVGRFGCEQEMFLVNRAWTPAPVAVEVLDRLGDGPFTMELARFNLEVNVEPRRIEGACFSWLEGRLNEILTRVREAAAELDAEVCLAGILPTLAKSDLSLDNISPKERYYALNDALTRLRGGAYRLRIEGTDELHIEHDSVMLEACNTSCQIHLQVSPDEFARMYNTAQAITGPVLAACVNSPLLFGKRLWAETRIALFQQSLDTRSSRVHLRELSPRVRFGSRWVESSVTELFEEDIADFRVLLTQEIEQDPFECLAAGRIPRLDALKLHNSTVYRWNRPCYGISDGNAHLRIECRALPAGPTVRDEVANAAFWIGLAIGAARRYGDITESIEFEDVKSNFLAASRRGLNAGLRWVGQRSVPARELILDTLLPMARDGLEGRVESTDIDLYLGVIEERVKLGATGSAWVARSLRSMKGQGTRAERLSALTAATVRLQWEGEPVHTWEPAGLSDAGLLKPNYMRVEQYMATQLFTVHEDELVEMVAFLMDRNQIRHVPVEDGEHRLVGLVSYRSILRMASEGERSESRLHLPVRTIMEPAPLFVAPETATLEAIDLMRTHKISCLPVVKNDKLVGLVTERDFMSIAYQLLDDKLTENE
ncbi:MAG: glutamate-cysteine ligase family protein [Gemmatimonadota bacterium]|nr:MAG: glutamate-cysteine ligase family protein [Gemmatimonadota bacterium]